VEALKQGKGSELHWTAPVLVSRADPKGLSDPAMKRAFSMSTSTLPAYAGVEGSQGDYIVLRINRVVEPEKVAPEKQNNLAESVQQAWSEAQMTAYVSHLRAQADVKIKQELLEKR